MSVDMVVSHDVHHGSHGANLADKVNAPIDGNTPASRSVCVHASDAQLEVRVEGPCALLPKTATNFKTVPLAKS